jgi:hypothetical protein
MDSWNVTGFVFVFFCRSGMGKIRRTASSRQTGVCTSIAAMPVETYKLRSRTGQTPWGGEHTHRWELAHERD